jgi:hypothetical protein
MLHHDEEVFVIVKVILLVDKVQLVAIDAKYYLKVVVGKVDFVFRDALKLFLFFNFGFEVGLRF